MFSCMELCTKFGTRAPSIVTFDEWSSLQLFLKEKLFDKSQNNSLKIWMSVLKTDDEWGDFYSNKLVEYRALKTNNESKVSGKWWERQSCVAQGNTNRLYFHKKVTSPFLGLVFICFTNTDGIYKIALNTATAVPAQSPKAPMFNSEDFAKIHR